MDLADAKRQAENRLRPFVGSELDTEGLNAIENETNSLILAWAEKKFFVHDNRGNLIRGIKLWYDLFTGDLRFAFRYPSQPMNIRK